MLSLSEIISTLVHTYHAYFTWDLAQGSWYPPRPLREQPIDLTLSQAGTCVLWIESRTEMDRELCAGVCALSDAQRSFKDQAIKDCLLAVEEEAWHHGFRPL